MTKYGYTFRINALSNNNIEYLNTLYKNRPNQRVLLCAENTKALSSEMLNKLPPSVDIRIAGGFTEDRVERNKNLKYNNGESGEIYWTANIFSKQELSTIVKSMENIESKISDSWSDVQKLVYIYDRLKTGIIYDPKFKSKSSRDVRSLRGLITRKTVCAGYAIIFKELMDRQGISCDYVEGQSKGGGHAWNLVTLDGHIYPIDLTWDANQYARGDFKTREYLGVANADFYLNHLPFKEERIQNYQHTLSSFDTDLIKSIHAQITRAKDYISTTFDIRRDNGTEFLISQVGNNKIAGTNYFRYFYSDILKNGKRVNPSILYSEVNLLRMVESIRFKTGVPDTYVSAVTNRLFSKENVEASLANTNGYVGKLKKPSNPSAQGIYELDKSSNKVNFNYPTKIYTRDDGSQFVAQQMLFKPKQIGNHNLMRYDIFESVNENGSKKVKKNTIFTERNFFNDQRPEIPNDYLSRSRIDRKVKTSGGYMGYYDENGIRTYYSNLEDHFDTSKGIHSNPRAK